MSLSHNGEYYTGEQAKLEEIPQEDLEIAINTVRKMDCPECGGEMFYHVVPGHNSSSECNCCGERFTVVG